MRSDESEWFATNGTFINDNRHGKFLQNAFLCSSWFEEKQSAVVGRFACLQSRRFCVRLSWRLLGGSTGFRFLFAFGFGLALRAARR
jgi:hypothetical protein